MSQPPSSPMSKSSTESSTDGAVLVGIGQVRNKPGLDGPFEPLEPARLMATALERAIEDAGFAVEEADFLGAIAPIAWRYDDCPAAVARMIGAKPDEAIEPPAGGESPCALLNQVANRVLRGEIRIALLTGAETMYSRRRAYKEGRELDWTPGDRTKDILAGQRPFSNAIEMRHGLFAPIHVYPLFENALRAAAGRSIEEHQEFVSRFMARYSEVAAGNPFSWFPEPRTAEQIRTVDEKNRWVCFPYPKLMNALMEVDQAAAVVVMSEAEADRLGIPAWKRVAYLGGAKAVDAWTPTERLDFVSSPAYRAAAKRAMEFAGVDLGRIDLFDLYSCFPSAVELAAQELGLSLEDPRGLTLTGGLAHHGGPGNNYAMHALANAVSRLREGPGRTALVSGLGMTATKHAVSILSTDVELTGASERSSEEIELAPELVTGPELVDQPDGTGRIETYTVEFERSGTALRGVVVVRLDDGRRTVAHVDGGPDVLARLVESEAVGLPGRVSAGGEGPNSFQLG